MLTYIRLDMLVEEMNKMGVEWNYDGIPKIEYPPCDIGDTIYEPFLDKVMLYTVDEIRINSTGIYIYVLSDRDKPIPFNAELIGKSIFLTYEEAEERLIREKEE